ncbi:hypothetical protein ACFODT_03020 [Vibrio zhugei]|uniref:Uncharacterized protein n=1 Tax=Vibrio zhugei TaxID=2479546 RepID=A0ABV7C7I4_9VIBR|nr:hypothetical protein [Vibrio zhugei]
MIRFILLLSILMQIGIALTEQGWLCYAAQLSAFLSCIALALSEPTRTTADE